MKATIWCTGLTTDSMDKFANDIVQGKKTLFCYLCKRSLESTGICLGDDKNLYTPPFPYHSIVREKGGERFSYFLCAECHILITGNAVDDEECPP